MRSTLILTLLLLQSTAAHAALGGAPSNFGATQPARLSAHRLEAANSSGAAANYTVSETTLDSGTVVREYAAASGTVFAVSWNGPFVPDLRTLLGSHFDTMARQAAKTPHAGHSQFTLNQSDVVIESGGHMRAYMGRAWIPDQLPAGFASADIN
jgi:hypothetical protein